MIDRLHEALDTCVDFTEVAERVQGYDCVIFDCDSTLFPHGRAEPHKQGFQLVRQLQQQGVRVVMASNNHGADLMQQRAEVLGLDADHCYIATSAMEKKPLPTMIDRIVDDFDLLPSQVAAVGDGLTDMIAYWRAGVLPVLIQPYPPGDARGIAGRALLRAVWGKR
jgi:HAD superfamily hydrolase (TIGR01662 family)